MLYLPVKAIKLLFPSFLPYNVSPRSVSGSLFIPYFKRKQAFDVQIQDLLTKLSFSSFFFSDSPASELYLELLLLQVVVPALLEQGHTRQWLKNLVRVWCIGAAWVLEIRSYLLGDVPLDDQVRT